MIGETSTESPPVRASLGLNSPTTKFYSKSVAKPSQPLFTEAVLFDVMVADITWVGRDHIVYYPLYTCVLAPLSGHLIGGW